MNILNLRRSLLPSSGFCMPSDGSSGGEGNGGNAGGAGGFGGSDGYGNSTGDGGRGASSEGTAGEAAASANAANNNNVGVSQGDSGLGARDSQAAHNAGVTADMGGWAGSSTNVDSQGMNPDGTPSGWTGNRSERDARDAGNLSAGNADGSAAGYGPNLAGTEDNSKVAGILGALAGFLGLGFAGVKPGLDIGRSIGAPTPDRYGPDASMNAPSEGGPQGDGGGGNSGIAGAAGTNPFDPNGPKTTTGLPAAAAVPKYVWDGHKYVETATGAQNVMRPDLAGNFQQTPYTWQAPPPDGSAPAAPPMMDSGQQRPPGNYAKGGEVGIAAGAPEMAGMVRGAGDGQSDSIKVKMDDGKDGRLGDGEYVITADVVSALGSGSSDAGARVLDDFMARVRSQAHGSPKQSRPVNPAEVLPA